MRADRGALIALGMILVAIVLVAAATSDEDDFIYKYQTLLTGVLAVGAAMFSVRAVHMQIAAADQIERDRRNRGHLAARAVLPVALAAFCEYARHASTAHGTLYASVENETLKTPIANSPEPPAIRESALSILKEFASLATDDGARLVAKMVAILQILSANLNETLAAAKTGAGERVIVALNIESYGIYAATLYARASAFIPFARLEQEQPPDVVLARNLDAAAFIIIQQNEFRDAVRGRIEKRYGDLTAEIS